MGAKLQWLTNRSQTVVTYKCFLSPNSGWPGTVEIVEIAAITWSGKTEAAQAGPKHGLKCQKPGGWAGGFRESLLRSDLGGHSSGY